MATRPMEPIPANDVFAGMGGESWPTNALPAEPTGAPMLAPPALGGGQQAPSQQLVLTSSAPGAPAQVETAIDKLRPGSELHTKVYDKLKKMLDFSRGEMKKRYSRWNYNEEKLQAFCSLEDYDAIVGSWQDRKGILPPEPISITVPYLYATTHAAATFVSTVLLGQKPMFPLVAVRGTETERARHMELALQSQLDQSRGYETLWQFIWDSFTYSFGATRNMWEERKGPAIRWVLGKREMVSDQLTFAGNSISPIDPYSFYPDPRVPLSQCNVRGDFMFTEMNQSNTVLHDLEKEGLLKFTKAAIQKAKGHLQSRSSSDSRRRVKIGITSELLQTPAGIVGFTPVIEGTVRLNPKDWGLGPDDRSQLWKFTFTEGGQIMQAEPLGMIHGQHPYTVSEPASLGHDFMSLSWMDMIGPFQDILSWIVSSRMENVRTAINNQFVADPSRVDINDIRSSAIGRIIRLKQQAMGLPVKEAIMQLQVMDVTQGHLADLQSMRILADTITGVNDNMRGIQTAGGRRSATEARMSMQAGASRLSQMAVRMSSQGMLPLANQMILNTQQFMPDEMWVELTGDDGQQSSRAITPEMLIGNFNYQVSDGSLPFDKSALMEVWKEILFGIARDPELRQQYDLASIFDYVAKLGGAKNIDAFKRQPQQPGLIANAAPGPQPGQVPLGTAMPQQPLSAGTVFGAMSQAGG